ncbi:MAG: hypothetical protein ACE5I3_11405 [Phycisphaerae bacterium]
MKRRSPGELRKPSLAVPVMVLLGALLVSVAAGWNAVSLCVRLPLVRTLPRFLPVELRRETLRRSLRSAPPEVREAFALQLASDTLAGALMGQVEPERLQSIIADAVAIQSRSQVGRLQQVAARMWLMEQLDEPLGNWWPSSRLFLEGMQRADLAHYQAPLAQHWARAYESLLLAPGTAYGLAVGAVGQPHGPFLLFVVERVRRVINERHPAGDAAAATTCRQVLYRLLRQWVLEAGPAGLRLLAADLLAESLEADSAATTTPEMQAITQDLRAWRSAYRRAARERPMTILDAYRRPALAPAVHERLVNRLALTTWLGSATLAAGVAALLLGWAWLGRGRIVIRAGRLSLRAIVVAGIVTVAGAAWVYLWPESVREDLRGDFSSLRYWWHHPFVAAGLTLILVLAGGLLERLPPGRTSDFLARLGTVAAGTWLVLGLALWGSAIAGEFARRDYERVTRAAHEDAVTAMIGPEAEHHLAALRQWEP